MSQDSLNTSRTSLSSARESTCSLVTAFAEAITTIGQSSTDAMAETVSLAASYISQLGTVCSKDLHSSISDLIDAICSMNINSSIPVSNKAVKELLKAYTSSVDVPSTPASDDKYVTITQDVAKEYELPDSIAIPVGHNRIKIKFETLIAIVGIIISLFTSLKPSANEQEQILLQQTEVHVLSNILDSVETHDIKTAEKLEELKQSVDEANSHLSNIEQYLKKTVEADSNETKHK